MSLFKRNRRAAAKKAAGRGRHARPRPPVEAILPAAPWPPQVAPELASREYEFPHVELPTSRPVHADQVLAELADDDTQPLERVPGLGDGDMPRRPRIGVPDPGAQTGELPRVIDGLAQHVVDGTPQPAHAPGLGPVLSGEELDAATARFLDDVPFPTAFFLNAGAPAASSDAVTELLPELRAQQLGSTTVVLRVPTAPKPPVVEPEPSPRLPLVTGQRQYREQRHFYDFDPEFYTDLDAMLARVHAAEYACMAENDARDEAIEARLNSLIVAHEGLIEAQAPAAYAEQLAAAATPALPQRIPGAGLFLFSRDGEPVPAAVTR